MNLNLNNSLRSQPFVVVLLLLTAFGSDAVCDEKADNAKAEAAVRSYNVALMTLKSQWQHIHSVIRSKEIIEEHIYPIATDDEYENPLANIQRMMLGDQQTAVMFDPVHFVETMSFLKAQKLVRQILRADGGTLSFGHEKVSFPTLMDQQNLETGPQTFLWRVSIGHRDTEVSLSRTLHGEGYVSQNNMPAPSRLLDSAGFTDHLANESGVIIQPLFGMERDRKPFEEREANGFSDYLVIWPADNTAVANVLDEDTKGDGAIALWLGKRQRFAEMQYRESPKAWTLAPQKKRSLTPPVGADHYWWKIDQVFDGRAKHLPNGGKIAITWSEEHDELWGISSQGGKWTSLKIEKQAAIEPVVARVIAAVRTGDFVAAYSGITNSWDLLRLGPESTAVPEVLGDSVQVSDNQQLYTFAASEGFWVSPTDADFKRNHVILYSAQYITAEETKQKLDSKFGVSASFRTAVDNQGVVVIAPKIVQEQVLAFVRSIDQPKPVRLPDRSKSEVVGVTAHRLDDLPEQPPFELAWSAEKETSPFSSQTAFTDGPEEQKSIAMAKTLRAAESVTELQQAELRKLVTDALEVRSAKQKLQVEQLKAKLSKVEKAWTERQRAKDRIVERRVEELLDPNVKWETVNTPVRNAPRTADWPIDFVATESIKRPLILSPTMTAQEARAAVAESGATSVSVAAAAGHLKMTQQIYRDLADHWRALGSYHEVLQVHMTPYGELSPRDRKLHGVVEHREGCRGLCQRRRQELLERIAEFRNVYRAYESHFRVLELNVKEAQSNVSVAIDAYNRKAVVDKKTGKVISYSGNTQAATAATKVATVAFERAKEQLSVFQAVVDESPHFNPAHPETAKLIRYIETVDVLDVEKSGKVPSPRDMKLPDTL